MTRSKSPNQEHTTEKHSHICAFWLIWDASQWVYIIMIHEWIIIWDHDPGFVAYVSYVYAIPG